MDSSVSLIVLGKTGFSLSDSTLRELVAVDLTIAGLTDLPFLRLNVPLTDAEFLLLMLPSAVLAVELLIRGFPALVTGPSWLCLGPANSVFP